MTANEPTTIPATPVKPRNSNPDISGQFRELLRGFERNRSDPEMFSERTLSLYAFSAREARQPLGPRGTLEDTAETVIGEENERALHFLFDWVGEQRRKSDELRHARQVKAWNEAAADLGLVMGQLGGETSARFLRDRLEVETNDRVARALEAGLECVSGPVAVTGLVRAAIVGTPAVADGALYHLREIGTGGDYDLGGPPPVVPEGFAANVIRQCDPEELFGAVGKSAQPFAVDKALIQRFGAVSDWLNKQSAPGEAEPIWPAEDELYRWPIEFLWQWRSPLIGPVRAREKVLGFRCYRGTTRQQVARLANPHDRAFFFDTSSWELVDVPLEDVDERLFAINLLIEAERLALFIGPAVFSSNYFVESFSRLDHFLIEFEKVRQGVYSEPLFADIVMTYYSARSSIPAAKWQRMKPLARQLDVCMTQPRPKGLSLDTTDTGAKHRDIPRHNVQVQDDCTIAVVG
jgi:hypothetical protein